MNKKKVSLIIGGVALLGIVVLLVINLFAKPFNDTRDLTAAEAESMRIGGEEAEAEATEQLKEYPVLEWIPYVVDEYSADMTIYTHYEIWPEYEDDKFTVVIRDYTGGNERVVREVMEKRGVKLADYDIRYDDLSVEYNAGSVRVPDD